MDEHLIFNRKSIDDRQVDTLIGLSKGLLADGQLVPAEVEFLHTWLVQARHATTHPIIINLFDKVSSILSDGVVDPEEGKELLGILAQFNGEKSELGEIAKPTTLPLNVPAPTVDFTARQFLFTGTCAYGTRKQCEAATKSLGGLLAQNVNQKLHYLVIGSYVTDSWAHETFGRKIELAMEYRDRGLPLAIISEVQWAKAGRLIDM